VIPCMMPRHSSPELTGRWREAVGPVRTAKGFRWRELLDTRAPLAFASDWPVADMNPLVSLREAVARRTPAGDPSPHRVSVREAIDAYTRGAAYACHAESTRGALERGKYADCILLSEDLFEIPPERITEAKVLRTVVGGRTVYSDGTPLS
ncbi:MAG: amidohydrolase family protein, partial [Methanobacteriota archaeon]